MDKPLVGGMLIDEHDAGRGLGQNIGAVQLRPRRTEWRFRERRRWRGRLGRR